MHTTNTRLDRLTALAIGLAFLSAWGFAAAACGLSPGAQVSPAEYMGASSASVWGLLATLGFMVLLVSATDWLSRAVK